MSHVPLVSGRDAVAAGAILFLTLAFADDCSNALHDALEEDPVVSTDTGDPVVLTVDSEVVPAK